MAVLEDTVEKLEQERAAAMSQAVDEEQQHKMQEALDRFAAKMSVFSKEEQEAINACAIALAPVLTNSVVFLCFGAFSAPVLTNKPKKIIPSFEVPIPSMKIQAKIVEAMNSIDNEYNHNPLTLDKELEAKRAVLSKYLQ